MPYGEKVASPMSTAIIAESPAAARGRGQLGRLSVATFSPFCEGSTLAKQVAGRILIAEDEYFVAIVSEDTLLAAGFEVIGIVPTAEEAVNLADKLRPDLVLMDIRLAQGGDGIKAAAEIMNRFNIQSIFTTAHSDMATRTRGDNMARPLGWLIKPFVGGAVVAAVEDAMRRIRQSS